jgi:hypothetical protein
MVYVSARSAWVALVARSRRRHSDPGCRGQRPARPISWVGSSSAGHKVAAVKLCELFCAMRAGLNTTELIAVRCLNPLCQPSFCDESHSAATKNLDRSRTRVFRANFPR